MLFNGFIKRAASGGGMSDADAIAMKAAIESRGGTVTSEGAVPTVAELQAGILTIPFMFMNMPTISAPDFSQIGISINTEVAAI